MHRRFLSKYKTYITLGIFSLFFIAHATHTLASSGYYFNNAVNQSPTEQGNYWNNSDATDPVLALPDNEVDEITILPDSTYDGDAIFNGSAINNGTVTGDAVFRNSSQNDGIVLGDTNFNDSTINNGTVENAIFVADSQNASTGLINVDAIFNNNANNAGTVNGNALFNEGNPYNTGQVFGIKTRRYSVEDTDGGFNVTGDAWTILADGIVLNVSSSEFDETTTFSTANGGSFIMINELVKAEIVGGNIVLTYTKALNPDSIPSSSDYSILRNGVSVPITSINITNAIVTIILAAPLTPSDEVQLGYTPGATPLETIAVNTPVDAINNLDVYFYIYVQGSPALSYSIGAKLYVANTGSNSVSVINTLTDTVITTVVVESNPLSLISIGNKLYVANANSNSVSVINTTNNTVIATISVGTNPVHLNMVGTKLYVLNYDQDTVSVINTTTDTVVDTIAVGNGPIYSNIVGSNIYISNTLGGSVSVIDTVTDTVAATISVGNSPRFIISLGTKVYVANRASDSVSVINTLTNAVIATIAVGDTPFYFSAVSNKVYVGNIENTTISVIDSASDTLINTITVPDHPYYMVTFDNKLFFTNNFSDNFTVVDANTNTVIISAIPSGHTSIYPSLAGSKIYVSNGASSSLTVLSTSTLPSQLPNLVSFTSTTSSGTYTSGQSINITANFGRSLQAGSTMTVGLNTGETVVLNNVSGTTLTGTYVISIGAETPDLAVTAIISSNVTDSTGTYNRTSHELPSSQGSFTAENSFITRNIGDSKNIKIGSYESITTGSNPYQISVPINGYLYVANQGAGTVSVIRISDNTLTDTITVGDEPYGLTYSNSQLYVANTGSDTVSVIDPSTNTVTDTISVGVKPYYVEKIGNTVYVTNGASNTVSVINTTSNTVTDTISVGSYPRGIKAHGTDLYVANYGDPNYSGGNYISVIDSLTNEVTDTIILPGGSDGPRGVTVLDSKVYVTNFRSNNVSVINTATNTITDTTEVGTGPRGIIGLGTNIYVENFDDGTISVIDTNSNTVTDTITVGHSPAGMSISGTDIYLTSFQDNKVYILDTLTNTLQDETTTPDPDPTPTPNVSGSSKRFFLQPTTPVSVITPPVVSTGTILTKTLKLKMTDLEVKKLQIFLNGQGFILAKSGAGSPGKETNKFGVLTLNAVKKFQKKYGLKVDGIVGMKTREVVEGVR